MTCGRRSTSAVILQRPEVITATVVVVIACNIICRSSARTAEPVELTTDVNIFVDPVSNRQVLANKRYFRYLSLDAYDQRYLYAGAIDHVYKLDASDISKDYVKSVNLSHVDDEVDRTTQDNLVSCVNRGKDLNFACQNHVRAVFRVGRQLFVCSTGVDAPIVYYLDANSLEVLSVELRGGRAKCPYHPDSNYTIILVESGNPGGLPATYSGTVSDFSNAESVIFRPPLTSDKQQQAQHADVVNDYRLLRTEQDSKWLNDPKFVGSFDVDDYVYFFFRENALEHAGCGKLVFSRVARLCKNDEGGSSMSMNYRWTTFLKARLNCSQPGDTPFYFNEIYDVQYNATERVFVGLFRTIQAGFWGSAVCSFSVDAVNRVFDAGPFKGQQSYETGWFSVPERDVPVPRPGQCRHSSLELSTSALAFIKSHPLMHDCVDTVDSRPLYFTKHDEAFTQLAVDHVAQYTVFFLASSRGYIHKVAQWRDVSGTVQFLTVAVLKPFRRLVQPIWRMILHSPPPMNTPYLYLGTDDAVVQLPVNECYRYKMCLACVRDPYCGWDGALHACLPYRDDDELIQRVSATLADDVCNQMCIQAANKNHRRSTRTEVLQGAPLLLNCTDLPPGCPSSSTRDALGDGGVSWYLVEVGRTAPRPLVADGVDLLLTRDNGLIIMDVSVRHNGTFVCMLGGHTVAHHQVHVLPCRLHLDRDETWKQELMNWCNAYTAYKKEYNQWLCMKNQCIKERCIPQRLIDRCQP